MAHVSAAANLFVLVVGFNRAQHAAAIDFQDFGSGRYQGARRSGRQMLELEADAERLLAGIQVGQDGVEGRKLHQHQHEGGAEYRRAGRIEMTDQFGRDHTMARLAAQAGHQSVFHVFDSLRRKAWQLCRSRPVTLPIVQEIMGPTLPVRKGSCFNVMRLVE